jgi:hypothetical protein
MQSGNVIASGSAPRTAHRHAGDRGDQVKVKRFVRALAGVMTAGLLVGTMVQSVTAAPPRWSITSTQEVVGGVSSGSAQAFDVTITNNGPSNISSLFLLASKDTTGNNLLADPVVFLTSTERPDSCVQNGAVLCSFGAVNAGVTLHVQVAYSVPFSTGDGNISFELNTTGLVLGGNNSHGDATFSSQSVTLLTAADADKAGKWTTIVLDSLANNQGISSSNPQATKLQGLDQHVPASVEDGTGITFNCPKAQCKSKFFGQWSKVSVNNGAAFGTAFEVTITIAASALPSNLDPTKVIVYHVLNNGSVVQISNACTTTPPTGSMPECRDTSFDGSGNLVINVWVYENGGFKGAV